MKSLHHIRNYTLAELTSGLEVTIQGDPQCVISNVSVIQQAASGDITFLTNRLYKKYLATTQASAIILTPDDVQEWSGNAVICRDPYYIYAQIACFFTRHATPSSGIHPTVIVGEGCQIDSSATIGANTVVGDGVKIDAHVVVGPGCIMGDFVELGENTILDARVTLYHHVKVGKRARLASGVIIGSEGFGFAQNKGAWCKVPQLGSVLIGDDVDIGANTTIDRGAIEDTIIEDGVKLDNLIQIGHNVRIGGHTIVAGCVGIAGSTVIGKNCMIGGATGIGGHLTITDRVMITGMTAVSRSILQPGVYSSGVGGVIANKEWRKTSARVMRLEQLMRRVKVLESMLKEQTERN